MLTDLTLVQARDGLRRRDFTAAELTGAHLDAIEALNPRLNAYITVMAEQARDGAATADQALAKGDERPLLGLPLGIKDLFCTAGTRTTAGSRILEPFVPPYESTVTANLLRDGAVFLGKTNMDEFAMGSSNMTSAYGPVESPWTQSDNRKLVPGGSSGGSVAAVAARLALGATATDTGGSIRQPASFTGIVGIKPTYGRCSRWGVVAFASSLDQAGPVARTVRIAPSCSAAWPGSIPRTVPRPSTPCPISPPPAAAACAACASACPANTVRTNLPPEIDALWQQGLAWLREQGAETVERLAAAHEVRARHLLHRRPGRVLLEPRPL